MRSTSWRSLSRFKRRNAMCMPKGSCNSQAMAFTTLIIVIYCRYRLCDSSPGPASRSTLCTLGVAQHLGSLLLTGWKAVLQQLPSGPQSLGTGFDWHPVQLLQFNCGPFWFAIIWSPSPFGSVDVGLYRLMAFVDAKGFFLGKGHVWSKWLLHQI